MPDSLMFHIVTVGSAWITFANGSRHKLETGDFALVPQGRGHAIVDDPETRAINLFDYDRPLLSPRYELLEINVGGERTSLICGVGSVKDPAARRMVGLLPGIIPMKAATPGNEWLRSSIQVMMEEARSLGPGGDAVITRFSDIFVVQTIRHWFRTDPHARTGCSSRDRMASSLTCWIFLLRKRLKTSVFRWSVFPQMSQDCPFRLSTWTTSRSGVSWQIISWTLVEGSLPKE